MEKIGSDEEATNCANGIVELFKAAIYESPLEKDGAQQALKGKLTDSALVFKKAERL